jgi:cell wall/surface repeat protein
MKKRILSLVLTFSILLSALPLNVLTVFAGNNILYGDADGNGNVELLDVNLMERYIEGDEEAKVGIHFTEADVNADGAVDDTDVQMVKDYLVGNLDSLTPTLHTISFETAGGGDFAPVKAGDGYPYRGELPTPAKDDYVFVNWTMENGETYYPLTEVVSADMTLTAVYEPVESKEQLNITSFSLDNQKPDVSFAVTGLSSIDDVKANITVLPKDGSDPVPVDVSDNGDGTFTVYAPDGFNAGASYELTLGDGLTFVDKDAMFRTAYFIIEKTEADNLKYNPDMIFIKDTEEMKYTIGGEKVDVLQSALLSNDEGTDSIEGSFPMSTQKLEQGDIVCIYQTEDPRNRDYTQDDYENDAMAFIEITGVDGNTYQFQSLDEEDSEEVLAMPDSFPMNVDELPNADGTIDVNSYDAYAWTMLGKTGEPQFEVNDFLTFYTADFTELTDETPVAYGQITKVEGNTISYKIVTKEDIDDYMGLFVSQTVDNSDILDDLNEEELLQQVEQQAIDSGFAEEAANRMVQNALQTGEVQEKLLAAGITRAEISQLSAAASPMAANALGVGGRIKFTAGEPTVNADILNGTHFDNGIGIALNVSVVLSFDQKLAGKTNSLKIELTAGFEQEVALGFDIDIEDRWEWYFIIPVLEDVDVTASIDIQNYTYMSVGAKVYTVSEENIQKWKNLSSATADPGVQDAIRKINKLGAKVKKLQAKGEDVKAVLDEINSYKEQLPTVNVDGVEYSIEQLEEALGAEDVSSAFDEVFSAQNEAESKTGMEQLMDKYKEMLEQETDWVELINQPLINQTYWIAIAAVKVNLNFVVKANVNIQLGADMEYQVGKRYSFWIHILDGKSGSSEMDLIDERFAFQFYVMGTLGIKAGVKAEIAFGILSTDLASVGANVEFGAYVKLYGYFIYYFEDLRPANTNLSQETEEMMGALYVDFGLYVTVKFKTQVFFNAFKYEPTLYDDEFPLLTAGVQQNVYDFVYEPDEDDVLYVLDDDANSTNGISMALPEIYQTMKRIDLVTGEKSQAVYDKDKFIIVFDDERFSFKNGNIIVDVPENTRYLSCEARIIWKNDKLTFSKYDIAITVPVIWTNMSQSEMKEKFTASVAVGNETDGYTTVWSGRYGRLDVFDLPGQEEILELIDYDSYNLEDGTNLKYAEIIGYQEEATGQSLSDNKTWYFDVNLRQYTVTVTNVQNADGTSGNRTFTAKYGRSFDFSELQNTGTNNSEDGKYTRFLNLTDPNADEDADNISLTMPVNMAFAEKYSVNGATFKANYLNTALTATYEFVGLGNNVPPVEVTFRSGATPSYEGLADYVRTYGGENAAIISISPAQRPSENSITYTVTCEIDESKQAYTLSFDTNGGNEEIRSQKYLEGSVIMQPTEPTRAGYTFDGWYADEELTTAFDFDAGMPGKDTTVYAKWEANTYNIHLSTVYASDLVTNPTISIEYGANYPDLPDLSNKHANMSFKGWFTAESGGTQITSSMTFNQAQDQTIYARWEQKKELTANYFNTSLPQEVEYNKQSQVFNLTVSAEGVSADQFTIEYKSDSDTTAEWTTTPPTNAGTYLIRISRQTDNEYLAVNNFVLNNGGAAFLINKDYIANAEFDEYPISYEAENWVLKNSKIPFYEEWETFEYEYRIRIFEYDDPNDENSDSQEVENKVFHTETITKDPNNPQVYAPPVTIPEEYRWGKGYWYDIDVTITVQETQNYEGRDISGGVWLDANGNKWTSSSVTANTISIPTYSSLYSAAPAKPEQDSSLLCSSVSLLHTAPVSGISSTFNQLLTSNTAVFKTTPTTFIAQKSGTTPKMTLSPEEVVLNRGKEFEVTLSLDKAADVWGILAAVGYDPDVVELLGYTCGGIFTETQFTAQNDLTAAPYKLLATLDKIGTTSAEGDFATLKFKVKEDAPEKATSISLQALEVVGEKSAVAVNKGDDISMSVDETLPVISGIKDGETYYGDTVVTIDEENLATVTVNGESVTVTDGKFTLKPAQEKQTVIVTDKAGNSVTVTVTVNNADHSDAGLPGTGDSSNMMLWVALLFVSGGILGAVTYRKKRKSK